MIPDLNCSFIKQLKRTEQRAGESFTVSLKGSYTVKACSISMLQFISLLSLFAKKKKLELKPQTSHRFIFGIELLWGKHQLPSFLAVKLSG